MSVPTNASSSGSPTTTSIQPSSSGVVNYRRPTIVKADSPPKSNRRAKDGTEAKESFLKKALQERKVFYALCVSLLIHFILVTVMIIVAMRYQDYLESSGESDRLDHTDDIEFANLTGRSYSHRSSGYIPEAREMDRSKFSQYHRGEDWILDPGNSYRFRAFNCLLILFIPALITAIALVEESFVAQIWALIFQVFAFIFSIVIIFKDLYQVSTGLTVTRVFFYLNWVFLIVLSILVLKNTWPKSDKKVEVKVVKDEEFPDKDEMSPPRNR